MVDYPWSSYPAYINKLKCPEWLCRDKTYDMLGLKKKYQGYQDYVTQGVDEDILRFYSKGNILSVLGDLAFRKGVHEECEETDLAKLRAVLQDRPSGKEIVVRVAKIFNVSTGSITKKLRYRRTRNPARDFAMYVCQEYGNMSLKEIRQLFDLGHDGSASYSINKIRQELGSGEWKKEVKRVEKLLYIVK